ncbi:unnamed protein product [Owenia fusiformis]|uniref:AIG1-type G domain-containing protein n=1 Tax=Owenia fusiformis TaxID=6347 RepID=A0A8S4NBV5_OWEFU|nr:unnamed protein product [Owenia fusiformis]
MAQNSPFPGKPEAWKELTKRGKPGVKIAWNLKQTVPPVEVVSYRILYKVAGSKGKWKEKSITVEDGAENTLFETVITLKPGTYVFAIVVVFEDDEISEMSGESDEFAFDGKEESENIKVSLKSTILGNARKVQEGDGNTCPSVYQIELQPTFISPDKGIRKYDIGKNQCTDQYLREKVILIVGATGAGKSTLINVMVNYLYGFDLDDGKLLRLIDEKGDANQAESQTKAITAYTIHSQDGLKVANTIITIIDTPGFGDTSGIQRDEEIVNQIRDFFTSKDPKLLVDHIDLVGFVAQSSLPRLTPTQRYIFDKILSLFGKDIENKITMLLTFADGGTPNVLSGIKESGFKHNEYFTFNNSAFFIKEADVTRKTILDFWDMGEKSFKRFFEALDRCEPTSLALTKETLLERQQLQSNMDQMHINIREGLNKLEQLEEELKVVENHEEDMRKHKNFTYETEVEEVEKRHVGNHICTTYCITCNRTCHNNCDYKDNEKKKKCKVMNREGYCTACPGRCYYQVHEHRPFVMIITRKKVTHTIADLQQRYARGKKGQATHMALSKQIKADFEIHQKQTLLLIDYNRQTVERLNAIALKPNPTSTIDYIDTLIDAEMGDKKPGFQKRVHELRELRKKTEELADLIMKGGEDPFSSHRGVLGALEQKESDVKASGRFSSMFQTCKKWLNIGKTKEGISRKSKKPQPGKKKM